MIQNKDYLIYSLEKSIDNLEEIIKQSITTNIPEHKEIYFRLGTVIYWIGTCLEKLKGNNVIYTENEKDYVQAFWGAYNAQKHGENIIEFSGFISGNRWPLSFPFIFGDGKCYFKELDEKIIQRNNLIKKYNEILKYKDIIESINQIKNIILEKINDD